MKGLRVFLVDDHKIIRDALRDMLSGFGHQVVLEAATKEEGLEEAQKILNSNIDVAILDAHLGISHCDGHEIYKAIKKLNPDVTVVSFSFLKQEWGDYCLSKGEDSFDSIEEKMKEIAKRKGYQN